MGGRIKLKYKINPRKHKKNEEEGDINNSHSRTPITTQPQRRDSQSTSSSSVPSDSFDYPEVFPELSQSTDTSSSETLTAQYKVDNSGSDSDEDTSCATIASDVYDLMCGKDKNLDLPSLKKKKLERLQAKIRAKEESSIKNFGRTVGRVISETFNPSDPETAQFKRSMREHKFRFRNKSKLKGMPGFKNVNKMPVIYEDPRKEEQEKDSYVE